MRKTISLSFLSLAACADVSSHEESIDLTSASIIGGELVLTNTRDVAAIYHGNFSRPCSGTYLGNQWVITAAHCIEPGLHPDQLFVTSQRSPGPSRPLPNSLPLGTYSEVAYYISYATNVDVAMLRLRGPLLLPSTAPRVASTSSVVGQTLTCQGYGRSQNLLNPDTPEGESTTGAGTLRAARLLASRLDLGWEVVLDKNQAGQFIYHGDSGGPCFIDGSSGPQLVSVAKNINSNADPTTGRVVSVARDAPWSFWIDSLVDAIHVRSEILWQASNGQYAIWFMNGGTIQGETYPRIVGNEWQVQGTGDFDGEGYGDILWRAANGQVAIWSMNAGTIAGEWYPRLVGSEWKIEGVGDFDSDGRSDIVWRANNGQVAIWFMNGGAIVGEAYPRLVGSEWKIQGVGDFNADGRADILWQANNGQVAIWFMNGGAIVGEAYPRLVGSEWKIKGVGDFNADSRSDILWRADNGQVAIWYMNGGIVVGEGYPGGQDTSGVWQIQGVGDFDGNRHSDILWRATNGQVAIWFDGNNNWAAYPGGQDTNGVWQIKGILLNR